jgi:hypothetical protein
MICVNNFLNYLIDYPYRSYQILYLLHFIYYTTSRRSLKQEGVYVTSLSCEHMLLIYSLRTLACK